MKVGVGLLVMGSLLTGSGASLAQTRYATQDTVYIHAVEQALISLKKGECRPCLNAYQRAFTISRKSALSLVRAAFCAYQCQEQPVARDYIRQAVEVDYKLAQEAWEDAETYPELAPARSSGLDAYVRETFSQKDARLGLNPALKKQLFVIRTTDQKPRLRIDSVQKAYGPNSPQIQQLWQAIRQIDSLNLVKIERIIRQYGYPGKRLVGPGEMNTAWLVIQHSPLAVQERYLPLIRTAAEKGQTDKANLALLVDRIRMYKGQKQLYGSQVTVDSTGRARFHPIADEANVNKRRQEAGLEPIEEYAKQFGISYKPGGH